MVVVDRNQGLGVVVQDALEFAFRGSLQDAVDFFGGRVAASHERQVDQRHVDGRDADGVAVQLAVQFRQHEAHGGGGAGLGGDHAHGGRTGAAQVFVIDVGQDLVVGVGVHGGHQAVFQAQLVVQRLDQRGQAVGGARRVRDDGVGGLQHAVVHAVHDGGVDVLAAGSRDDDLLGAALDVRAGLFLGREEARALQDHVDLQLAPGQLGRVAVGQHADLVAVDDHEVAVDFDGARELAMGRVVARQVRVGLGIAQVVDGDDFDIVLLATFVVGTQDVAADATVTIDGDANGHD
ncbi:hypothetical protein D9M68_724180 [compost metagenome]